MIKSSWRVQKILAKFKYSKVHWDVILLKFSYMKRFTLTTWLFNLYAMFTSWWSSSSISSIMLNTNHRLKYFCYLVIKSNNIFQTHFYRPPLSQIILVMLIKQFSYSFPTSILILTFFIHYEFFWIHDASEKIHRPTDKNNPDN